MLERDAELTVAGCRPSIWARVKVGAKKDGTLLAWQSDSWNTGGPGGGGAPPMPNVVNIPNRRKQHVAVSTNIGPARALPPPNHPQDSLSPLRALHSKSPQLHTHPHAPVLNNN